MMALTLALRELRGGFRDFRMFLGCLIIGVTVIACVGTLSARIENGIKGEAKTLLGGDVELSMTNQRATKEQLAFLQRFGRYSLSVNLRAMASLGDESVLTELRGVDADYPLLGTMQLASGASLQSAMKDGNVVVEQNLLDRLGAHVGDRITLGTASFTVRDVLVKEPDRIASAFSFGPRVLANLGDLQKSGLLQPGGLLRYDYHLLLRDPSQLESFKSSLARAFPHASWIVKTFNESNRTIESLVDRLQLFMTLAGLSSLLIGGVGLLNATESYIGRKFETIATLKSLGASRNTVFMTYVIVIFLVALLGIVISVALGEGLMLLILPHLAPFFPVSLDHLHDYRPLLLAAAFGMLTVFTFSIAALGRGVEVNPALLFRGNEAHARPLPTGKLVVNILFALALIASLLLSASDLRIAGGFVACALLCFLLFAGAALAVKSVARRLRLQTPWARLAVANLYRPGAATLSVMLSIGIGLTVLIALLEVEGNFEKEIGESIPAQAPSLFLIDIQPAQKDAFLSLLHSRPYISEVYSMPMVRGRIEKLNGVPVESAAIDANSRWATESDRGFSYSSMPPVHNRLVAGRWWPGDYRGKPLASLDRKLAEGMNLKVGDTLTLNILGQEIEATIANLREVNYATFRINFAIILSPGALDAFPATTIATARITTDADESAFIHETAKRFPNVSVIRIKDSLRQLEEIVGHIATAIRVTAATALVSGTLVLASALTATLDKRAYDIVVLKVLGARRRDILRSFLAEWLMLAFVTGVMACILGSCGAWLILKRLEWVDFHLIPSAVAETLALALVFVSAVGYAVQTRIFNRRPGALLRNE